MTLQLRNAFIGFALAVAALAWPGAVCGQGRDIIVTPPASTTLGPEWVAVPAARLAGLRGGFDLPSGLVVSFGIERVAYVNGELVASASLHIADVANMTPEQAVLLADAARPLVVQVGGGNRFDASGAIGTGAVIQNTLDGQDVRTLTTLNVGVGTLGLYQSLNAQSALNDALLGVVGGP